MDLAGWADLHSAPLGGGRISRSCTSTKSRAVQPPQRICWNSTAFTGAGRSAMAAAQDSFSVEGRSIAFTEASKPNEVPWEEQARRHRPRVQRQDADRRDPRIPTSTRGVRKVIVAAPVKQGRPEHRDGRERRALFDCQASRHRHGRVLHDQLSGSGGQGYPRRNRNSSRRDYDHPRRDEHADHRRSAPQGPAAGAFGPPCRSFRPRPAPRRPSGSSIPSCRAN